MNGFKVSKPGVTVEYFPRNIESEVRQFVHYVARDFVQNVNELAPGLRVRVCLASEETIGGRIVIRTDCAVDGGHRSRQIDTSNLLE